MSALWWLSALALAQSDELEEENEDESELELESEEESEEQSEEQSEEEDEERDAPVPVDPGEELESESEEEGEERDVPVPVDPGEELDGLDGLELPEPALPEERTSPGQRAAAARGALRLLGGVSRWRDPGAELALALDNRLAGPFALRLELGSQLVRALPAEGAGAVGVALPVGAIGLVAQPAVAGALQPRAGLDLLGMLYLGSPLAMGPGLRLRAGADLLAGPIGLSLEGHAGAVYAPLLAALDPRDPPMTALFGVRAGPVVRW